MEFCKTMVVTGELAIPSDGKWRLSSNDFHSTDAPMVIAEPVKWSLRPRQTTVQATNSQVPVEIRQGSHLHPALVAEHLTVPTAASWGSAACVSGPRLRRTARPVVT